MLSELELDQIPRLIDFNKSDLVDPEVVAGIVRQVARESGRECLAISAAQPQTFGPLLEKAGLVLRRNLGEMPPATNEYETDAELVETK